MQLRKSLEELNDLFQQILVCMDNQSERVDNVEVAVQQGLQNVDLSADCIQRAIKNKARGRKRKFIICGGATTIAIAVGVILVITLA